MEADSDREYYNNRSFPLSLCLLANTKYESPLPYNPLQHTVAPHVQGHRAMQPRIETSGIMNHLKF